MKGVKGKGKGDQANIELDSTMPPVTQSAIGPLLAEGDHFWWPKIVWETTYGGQKLSRGPLLARTTFGMTDIIIIMDMT